MADEEEVPAGPSEEQLRRESIAAAGAIIDEVLASGGEQLYKKYLDDRVSEFAVRMATEEMTEVVKWHFMSRDEGEGELAEKASWMIDEEPEPAEIDSWARGALQTRKKPAPSPPPTGASLSTEKGDVKRSRRSRRPSQQADKPPKTGESQVEAPSTAGSRTTADPAKKKKKDEPKPPTAAERQRKLVEEAKAKRATENKQEADQLAKVKKETKDKAYIYDRNGAVVIIDEPDPSKMPATSVAPSVGIKSAVGADYQLEAAELRKVLGAARPSVSQGDAERAKVAQAARQAEQQPSLVESMDVTMGVTLQEGPKTKAGPQRKAEPGRMTWKDFQANGGGAGSQAVSAAPDISSPVAAAPEPDPEPMAEPEPTMDMGSAGHGDTVPLKDLPPPPKASQRQKEEQMGQDRLRFPRDRPYVNPNLPTRPIMPDKTSNLASNQDKSPVGRPARLPPVLEQKSPGDGTLTIGGGNKLTQVDQRLAQQLLQPGPSR